MSTIHNTLIKNKIKIKNLEREWKGKRRKKCMFLVLDLVIQKFITVFQKINAGFPIETSRIEEDVERRSLFDHFLFWHAFRDMVVQKMGFSRYGGAEDDRLWICWLSSTFLIALIMYYLLFSWLSKHYMQILSFFNHVS